MPRVVRATVCAAWAALLPLSSQPTRAAEIPLPYAGARVTAHVGGHSGFGHDEGSSTRVETQTHITNDLREPGTADATAVAKARSTTIDSLGVFASLNALPQTAVYPGTAPLVEVRSDAFRETYFRVESDELAAGRPVDATIRLHFDGTMSIADRAFDPDASTTRNYAEITASVDVYDAARDLVTFYRGSAFYLSSQGFLDYSGWDGQFSVAQTAPGNLTAAMDYTTEFVIQTEVGEVLMINLALFAETVTHLPGDVSMTVDFFNTGSFALETATPGVRITAVVPEPAGLALLGAATIALLRRRR